MNKVILMGRLAKDVELRYTQTGKAVATFTLAVDRKKGENAPANAPTADFIPCVAWDKLAEIAGNYLSKGRQALVEGHIQVRSYKAKDGSNRYTTEVILEKMEFVDSKSDNENNANNGNYGQQGFGFDNGGSDEDIPF